jgi:hypothetical protein
MSNSFNTTWLEAKCAPRHWHSVWRCGAQDSIPQDGNANIKAILVDVHSAVAKSRLGNCWHNNFALPSAPGPACDANDLTAVGYVASPTPVVGFEPAPPLKSEPVPPPAQ